MHLNLQNRSTSIEFKLPQLVSTQLEIVESFSDPEKKLGQRFRRAKKNGLKVTFKPLRFSLMSEKLLGFIVPKN